MTANGSRSELDNARRRLARDVAATRDEPREHKLRHALSPESAEGDLGASSEATVTLRLRRLAGRRAMSAPHMPTSSAVCLASEVVSSPPV